jgi:glycerol transport system permease protein
MNEKRFQKRTLFLFAYLLFAVLPIYWMINMSFKTNEEILSTFTFFPQHFTWANYKTIFTDESWYSGYINSLIYVSINMVITLTVALPAAYAFSRYSFLGDKHVFFWLLTNRMTPPAVFLLPFFQLYTTVGLMDTHIAVALAHLLFSVPLAVWILEGFMSGIPREIDETAYIDGYSFPRFFLTIFLPLIKAGVGVAAFFCFMFSWVELLLARTLTSVNAKPIVATMTRTVSASGMDWATLAAAGVLTIVPGAIVIWFVRHYIAKGFAMGLMHPKAIRWAACPGDGAGFARPPGCVPLGGMFDCLMDGLDHARGRVLHLHRAHAHRHDGVGNQVAHHPAQGLFAHCHHAGGSPFHRPVVGRLCEPDFCGLSGRMAQWLSLENEPSVWISFVLSMALLGLILRKG